MFLRVFLYLGWDYRIMLCVYDFVFCRCFAVLELHGHSCNLGFGYSLFCCLCDYSDPCRQKRKRNGRGEMLQVLCGDFVLVLVALSD